MRPIAALILLLAAASAQDTAPSPPTAVFGTTVVRPFGLRGEIYAIKEGSYRLPDFSKLEPIGAIYTNSLNVPPRNFREGFPGVTNRFEWFAIDYSGRFYIDNPGKYDFRLTSDDGSKLYIDGALKINNDGQHLPESVNASLRIEGGIHAIRVSYFQGPCSMRAPCLSLQLFVKPPGEKWRIFSTDEFKPPSNPADWKYGDPNQLTVPPDPNEGRRKLRDAIKK